VKIALVGGVFSDERGTSARSRTTPETILMEGFLTRGHSVEVFAHAAFSPDVDADIVHVHHLGVGALAMASSSNRTPFVFTSHNGQIHSGFDSSFLHRRAFAYVLSRVDAAVALTDAESSFLRPYLGPHVPCPVIPNGVDGTRFYPERARKHDQGKVTILYVGQLIPVKGLEYLIDALALLRHHPTWRLRMVYHNSAQLEELKDRATRHGILDRIEFLGSVASENMGRIYREADLLVLPSLGEALPSVITEAFLSGLPVVATAITGLADQVNEYGILCLPADAASLARAMEEMMLRLPSFRARSAEMRDYALERFSIHAMVESHLRLYASVVSRGDRPMIKRVSDMFVAASTNTYRRARRWGLPPA
jgi:glycosyltransferase involved in cell wall biosynthesis